MKKLLQKIPKMQKYIFLIQLILFAAACLFWAVNRSHGFQTAFSPQELLVSESARVEQDVTIDAAMSDACVLLQTPAISLPKGVYQVTVHYNADRPDSFVTLSSELPASKFHCLSPISLNPLLHSTTVTLELTQDAEAVVLEADFSGEGYLSITGITFAETGAASRRLLLLSVLLCLLLEAGYLFWKAAPVQKLVSLSLLALLAVSSYPLFTDTILYGDDLYYHLLRIEGIAAGLSNGFPVKIHPVWAQDYGYAVGVFYGNLFLYFPAFLRLMGCTVQTAYQIFVLTENLCTIVFAYAAFRRIFQNRWIGVLGCAVYQLSFFRLMDVYRRAAAGETLAMMLFPLVLLGFYLIFTSTQETLQKKWLSYALLTAVSLTGIVQSHILSCEMLALILLPTCIVLFPLIKKRYTFRTLAVSALFTILFSLGFLVPLLDYYQEDILIASPQWTGSTLGNDFQANGVSLTQLFTLLHPSVQTAPDQLLSGKYPIPTQGLGICFFWILCAFLLVLLLFRKQCQKNRNFLPALFCFFWGILLLFFSTSLFPWNPLLHSSALAKKLISSLEFPWRLLAPASLLLTFVLCFTVSVLKEAAPKKTAVVLTVLCIASSLLTAVWFYQDREQNGSRYTLYAAEQLDTMLLSTNDYLPVSTDPDEIEEGWINQSGIASLEAYTKQGTSIRCVVTADGADSFIDFPLLFYKYYQCVAIDTKEKLPVSAGTNNMLRVDFPENFHGQIQISFHEPLFWRLSEFVSILSALFAVFCAFRIIFRKVK